MVVIRLAYTTIVNLPGAQPILSHAQVWAGLERKARVPQDFVPVVETCEIHSERDNEITATVIFKADSAVAHARTIREVCTLSPPYRLDYAMEDGSTATNIISMGKGATGDNELFLTFVFAWEHPQLIQGSDEARETEDRHKTVGGHTVAYRKELDANLINSR